MFRSTPKNILLGLGAVLLVFFAASFSLLNDAPARIHTYFGWGWEGPLANLLFVTLALGVALGMAGTFSTLLRLRRELGMARRALRSREREIAHLRALPIKDGIG